MKTNLKISILIPFLCTIAFVNAQEQQKWYADDIYYDTHEKEVEFFEVNFNFYEEEEIDNDDKIRRNELSYSARINRFHRNNYNPSLSFSYGYHHDPYHHFSSINYGYDPFFYDHHWHSYDYGWNSPYYGYNYYNSWHSPWHQYHYNWWDRPYKNVYYNTVVEAPFKKVQYGPRKGLTSNTPSRVSNSNINRQNRSTGSNRSNFNATDKRLNSDTYQRNKPNREKITGSDIYKDLKNTLERSVKEGRSGTNSNNTNRSYRSGRSSNSGNTNRSSNQSKSR
jgi:hypothetical protein